MLPLLRIRQEFVAVACGHFQGLERFIELFSMLCFPVYFVLLPFLAPLLLNLPPFFNELGSEFMSSP